MQLLTLGEAITIFTAIRAAKSIRVSEGQAERGLHPTGSVRQGSAYGRSQGQSFPTSHFPDVGRHCLTKQRIEGRPCRLSERKGSLSGFFGRSPGPYGVSHRLPSTPEPTLVLKWHIPTATLPLLSINGHHCSSPMSTTNITVY